MALLPFKQERVRPCRTCFLGLEGSGVVGCRLIFGGKGEMVFVGWGGKLEFAPESD